MKNEVDFKQIEKRKETLNWFQNPQMAKLLENTYKGDWINTSAPDLFKRLEDEVMELTNAIKNGNHKEIIRECADVANFAMFIADKYR